MKTKIILRIAVMATVLSLFLALIPASPVYAVPSGSVYPTSGPVGASVAVTCSTLTQCTPTDTYNNVYVKFDTLLVASGAYSGTTFTTTFSVPTKPRFSYAVKVYTTKPSTGAIVDPEITIATFQLTPQAGLSTRSGYVGDQCSISGNGFSSSSTISIYFDNDVVGTTTSNADGTLASTPFTIPAGAKGSHIVRARDSTDFSPGVTFNVNQKMEVSPASGAVADKITVSGTGFAANSNISFYWDDVFLSAGSAASNATGGFTFTDFTIPATSRGSHTIKAMDESANSATASFSIGQKMSISPVSGLPGTPVTITASGFEANKPVTVKYNAVPVTTTPATVTADANGSFTCSFNVPGGLPGTYTVEASDGTYGSTASFTTTSEAKISQETNSTKPGNVGMQLTISGSGFKPNAVVNIYYTSNPVELATPTTDGNGAFSVTVTIPPSPGGEHVITATDGTTIKNFTFYMEKNAPPAPEPLLPIPTGKQKAAKAQPLAQFDWGDVTDPSGFSYTLQVSLDKDFGTLVIEKKVLTKSEYTLGETEKLSSNKRSTPYYWRVRAIDGAFNEGSWSTPQPFNAGFSLEFTGWVLYTVLGIGGVLLFLLGFLLGSRRGYY